MNIKLFSSITILEENVKFYNNDLEKAELFPFAEHLKKTYMIKNYNQCDETNYEDMLRQLFFG